jgi:DNA-binding helix-hairpin-helix protein with protein kinase domain
MPNKTLFFLDAHETWHPIRISNEKLLGRGGSGLVYALSEDWAVKKYLPFILRNNTKKEELFEKIVVLAFKHPRLATLKEQPLAWPLGPVIECREDLTTLGRGKRQLESGEFCGFVMPRIRNFRNLEEVVADQVLGSRRISGADRIHIARRVAEVIQLCHDAELVVGDINMLNIVVTCETLLPTILDCDSFQYGNFAPELGTIEFASPELLGRVEKNDNKFDGLLRSVDDDRHALAVLIFKVLMNNRNPYDTAGAPPFDTARKSAIMAREFPYSTQSATAPPTREEAERYGVLPDDIKMLFEKALRRGESVVPTAWIDPLDQFADSPDAAMITPSVRTNFGFDHGGLEDDSKA